MDKKTIEHIGEIASKVEELRKSLESIAAQEQEEFDKMPYSAKAISPGVQNRIDAINDAVGKIIDAEIALDEVCGLKYSLDDMRMNGESSKDLD